MEYVEDFQIIHAAHSQKDAQGSTHYCFASRERERESQSTLGAAEESRGKTLVGIPTRFLELRENFPIVGVKLTPARQLLPNCGQNVQ